MHRAILIAAFMVLGIGVAAPVTLAQEVQFVDPPPFEEIKDTNLRSAFLSLKGIRVPDHPPYDFKFLNVVRAYARQFEDPKVYQACLFIARSVLAGAITPELLSSVKGPVEVAITGLVATARPEGIAVLVQLANSKYRWVRHAIADSQNFTEFRSREVLTALLNGAESRLPVSPDDSDAMQEAFDEFEYQLKMFCLFVSEDARQPAADAIARLYDRYKSDRRVRKGCEALFAQYLSPEYLRDFNRKVGSSYSLGTIWGIDMTPWTLGGLLLILVLGYGARRMFVGWRKRSSF